jgi:hypothetical protein
MPPSDESKRRALRQLSRTKEKAQALEFELRIQGNEEDANEVKKKREKLTGQIDDLLKRSMEAWLMSAAEVEADLNNANTSLQKAIRDIKGKAETAKNVVKAIGFIDDAVSIAGKLASPL